MANCPITRYLEIACDAIYPAISTEKSKLGGTYTNYKVRSPVVLNIFFGEGKRRKVLSKRARKEEEMSLLHRVTSYESLSPPRGRSPVGSHSSPRDRKLSFSPLPGSWDPPVTEEHPHATIGAFEVPKSKRICELWFLSASKIQHTDKPVNSTSRNFSLLLPLRSRYRLWLCCSQTSPYPRTCI